jgi:hypothetical protein
MILDLFRKDIGFDDDIKNIVRRALNAEDNYNLLFIVGSSIHNKRSFT